MRFMILSLILTGLCAMTGCDASQGEAAPSVQGAGARLRVALRETLQGRSARWFSPSVLCVVAFDEKTISECMDRPRSYHPADVQAAIRSELSSGASGATIGCVRVSRPIQMGDSTLVQVSTIGATVADGLVESESTWVWFRPSAGKDSIHVDRNPYGGSSDVAPMTQEARC
jgi:hypothetical protein